MVQAHPPTVLVVDDDFMVRMIAVEALRDAGFDVKEAEDGDAALDILRAEKDVDLLITDVKMPRMNGYQLADAVLTMRPDLKILMMTGYAQESLPPEMAQAGVQVLYKPFDISQLSDLAKEIIEK